MKWLFKRLCLLLTVMLWLSDCVSVKEYQKQYINDSDMELTARKSQKFENSFQSYREGAAGANGGKTGGGLWL